MHIGISRIPAWPRSRDHRARRGVTALTPCRPLSRSVDTQPPRPQCRRSSREARGGESTAHSLRSRPRADHEESRPGPVRTPARLPPRRNGRCWRGIPVEARRTAPDLARAAAGPVRGVRNLRQRPAAPLLEAAGRPPVEDVQYALSRQNRDRQDALPVSRGDGQRRRCGPERDLHVHARIVAGQPDHRRNQPGQLAAAGIRGVGVDPARKAGQQRMGARRMIAPSRSGEGTRPIP
jgi:hypothetical protein